MQKTKIAESVFEDLKGDDLPTVVESFCTMCQENGETRILLTKIPFFREIVVTSFYCDKCGNKNTEVQFAGKLPDYGVQILFKALQKTDIYREIILSDHAKIWVEELDLEMPKITKPQITTLQGLLLGVEEDLQELQEERKTSNPQTYDQISKFCEKLRAYAAGDHFPITIKIIDPSGNSFIKNPFAPKVDKNLQVTSITRTLEDFVKMGYSIENAQQQMKQLEQKKTGNKINFTKAFDEKQFMKYEPVIFDVPCHSCQLPGQMKMCQTSVPYFTDMVIMSFVCEYCGAHSTETKNTGDIKDQGCIIKLKADSDKDLKRDLFKSETCKVEIPEIELELDYGTLGGVFTTVEGLLEKIQDHLGDNNPFADSDNLFYERMQKLLNELALLRAGGKSFTLILRDPLGHSFLQNPDHPNEDKNAVRQLYKRSMEENETLGLNDIKTEGYQKDNSDTKSQGSMKKNKDRKCSQGSVESKEDQCKEQDFGETNEFRVGAKFTKESPHKLNQETDKTQ